MFEVMNIVSSPKKRKVAAGNAASKTTPATPAGRVCGKTTPAGRVTGKTTPAGRVTGKTTPAGRVTGKTTTVFVHQPQHFNFGAKGAIVVHNYTVRSEGYIDGELFTTRLDLNVILQVHVFHLVHF